jgi:hypothetical protein
MPIKQKLLQINLNRPKTTDESTSSIKYYASYFRKYIGLERLGIGLLLARHSREYCPKNCWFTEAYYPHHGEDMHSFLIGHSVGAFLTAIPTSSSKSIIIDDFPAGLILKHEIILIWKVVHVQSEIAVQERLLRVKSN